MNEGRRLIAVGVVAALALAVIGSTTGAAAESPDVQAVSAKKCKKKRGAASSRKRCKKRRHVQGPRLRATLSWTDPQEVDLHVYDENGNHSGWSVPASAVVQGIPNATHSGDRPAGGPSESFTDNIFSAGSFNREFSYIICFFGNGPIHTTFTAVDAYGAAVWTNIPLDGNPGEYYIATPPGGPRTPSPSTVCV
jgi:uncharacterized protein YfaP (DUF2135 family)